MRSIYLILLTMLPVFATTAVAQTHKADSLQRLLQPILEQLDPIHGEAKYLTDEEADSLVNSAANLLVKILEEPFTEIIDFEKFLAIPRVTRSTDGKAKIINIRRPILIDGIEYFSPVIQWRDETGQNHATRLRDSCKYSLMDRLGQSNIYLTFCDSRLIEKGPIRIMDGILVSGSMVEPGMRVFESSHPVVVPIDSCGFFYNADTDSFSFEESECPNLQIIAESLGQDWKQAALRYNGESFVSEKVK